MSLQPKDWWCRLMSARLMRLSDLLPVAWMMMALMILMAYSWTMQQAAQVPAHTPVSAKVANFGNRTKYGGGSGVGRRWVDFNIWRGRFCIYLQAAGV